MGKPDTLDEGESPPRQRAIDKDLDEMMECLGLSADQFESVKRRLPQAELEKITGQPRSALHSIQQANEEAKEWPDKVPSDGSAKLESAWIVCRYYYVREALLTIAENTWRRVELTDEAPRVKAIKEDLADASSACNTLADILNRPFIGKRSPAL